MFQRRCWRVSSRRAPARTSTVNVGADATRGTHRLDARQFHAVALERRVAGRDDAELAGVGRVGDGAAELVGLAVQLAPADERRRVALELQPREAQLPQRFDLSDRRAPQQRVLAEDVVDENILRGDDVTFRADHFRHVSDAARAVAQASRLHDDVDRIGDHLADRLGG